MDKNLFPKSIQENQREFYINIAARPRRPAPTTGAAVRTANALDEEDDAEFPFPFPLLPVALAGPLVDDIALLLLLLALEVPFLFFGTALAFMKFAHETAARAGVSTSFTWGANSTERMISFSLCPQNVENVPPFESMITMLPLPKNASSPGFMLKYLST